MRVTLMGAQMLNYHERFKSGFQELGFYNKRVAAETKRALRLRRLLLYY